MCGSLPSETLFLVALASCGGIASQPSGVEDAGSVDGSVAASSEGVLLCPFGMPDAGAPSSPSTAVTYDRSCTTSADCTIGTHYLDCCGTLIVLGINQDEVGAFDTNTGICHTPPTCRCKGRGAFAEDGQTSSDPNQLSDVVVSCTAGVCATRVVGK
jgi:hypothetical protein